MKLRPLCGRALDARDEGGGEGRHCSNGGVAPLRAKVAIGTLVNENDDIQFGINIGRGVLELPIRQISGIPKRAAPLMPGGGMGL